MSVVQGGAKPLERPLVAAERIPGGFILITGIEWRPLRGAAQLRRRDHADECHDEMLVQLYGGAVVRVPCRLDEVLAMFD